MRRLWIMAILLTAAASCGGRVSNPVMVDSPLDAKLSCAHLIAERQNNDKRLAELSGEKKDSSRDNVGLLLNPLFIDPQGGLKEEMAALVARNQRLDQLMAERGCAAPEIASEPAAPTDKR